MYYNKIDDDFFLNDHLIVGHLAAILKNGCHCRLAENSQWLHLQIFLECKALLHQSLFYCKWNYYNIKNTRNIREIVTNQLNIYVLYVMYMCICIVWVCAHVCVCNGPHIYLPENFAPCFSSIIFKWLQDVVELNNCDTPTKKYLRWRY